MSQWLFYNKKAYSGKRCLRTTDMNDLTRPLFVGQSSMFILIFEQLQVNIEGRYFTHNVFYLECSYTKNKQYTR